MTAINTSKAEPLTGMLIRKQGGDDKSVEPELPEELLLLPWWGFPRPVKALVNTPAPLLKPLLLPPIPTSKCVKVGVRVDLFESVVLSQKDFIVGCIMTGMGCVMMT